MIERIITIATRIRNSLVLKFEHFKIKRLVCKTIGAHFEKAPRKYLTHWNEKDKSDYHYKSEFKVGDIDFTVTRMIRGDIIELFDGSVKILSYVDQSYQYDGFLGTNDWRIDISLGELSKMLRGL